MRMSARFVTVLLGVWLFISAFAWPHAPEQLTNTWICGVVCVVAALVAVGWSPGRYFNTLLALWLLISAWVLPTHEVLTVWNNVAVAIAMLVLSLVPGEGEPP